MQVTLSFSTLRKHKFYLKQLVQHLHSKKHKRQLKCVVMVSCDSLNKPKDLHACFSIFKPIITHTLHTTTYLALCKTENKKLYFPVYTVAFSVPALASKHMVT